MASPIVTLRVGVYLWETCLRVGPAPESVESCASRATAAGTTAVEFAFIAPILLAVLLATLQIAVIFFARVLYCKRSPNRDGTRQVLTNKAEQR